MEVGSCYRPGLPFLLRKPPLPSPTCSTPSNLWLPSELNCEPSCGFIAFAPGPGCEPPRGQSRSPVEVVKAGSLVSMWTCWGLSRGRPVPEPPLKAVRSRGKRTQTRKSRPSKGSHWPCVTYNVAGCGWGTGRSPVLQLRGLSCSLSCSDSESQKVRGATST